MFNPKTILIDAFVEQLQNAYQVTYGRLEPHYPGIISWAGRMALECIADSDAAYHDVDHTVMVTLVGQEILKGKHLRDGGGIAAGLASLCDLTTLPRYRLCAWSLPG